MKKDLAQQLFLSNSEITNIYERLRFSGLLDVNTNTIRLQSLYEFLIYGFRYVFPAIVGPETRGILTGANALPDNNIRSTNYVWPTYEGIDRGYSIAPLYPEVIHAVRNDGLLYTALVVCDMLRTGQSREINVARDWFKKFLLEN